MLRRLWPKRMLYLGLLVAAALALAGMIVLNQPETECQLYQAPNLIELYTSQRGSLDYHGRYLYSNCYLVVTYLEPRPDSVSIRFGPYFDAYVIVIGGRHVTHMSTGVYQLVRFQMVPDCTTATQLAQRFLQEMRQHGLYAMDPRNASFTTVC